MHRRTVLVSLATAGLVGTLSTGCVTVHGELALVPSVQKAEAAAALANFAEVNNEANRTLDPSLNTTIETGALAAFDQAGIKAQRVNRPQGNPGYTPLELTDARFLIPRQRGWPKWFVADCDSNRAGDDRWLLVFQRSTPQDTWKASYLSVLQPDRMPEFATDAEGHVKPVPLTGSGLAVQPAELSGQYAAYLQKGTAGSAAFADGPATSQWREQRRKDSRTAQSVTQFADLPADSEAFLPVALRTEDGGALVFFTTHHQEKFTVAQGRRLTAEPGSDVAALLTGTIDRSLTRIRISEQAVSVPAKGAANRKVVFLNRISGLIAAKGS